MIELLHRSGGRLPTGVAGGVGSARPCLMTTIRLIRDTHDGVKAMDGGASWSLLKLNPQKQVNYVDLLRTYLPGVEAYYPVYSRVCRPHGSRRPVKVERPVYPGYVFVMSINGDLRGPVNLPVRASWVRFGGRVEGIPGFVVEQLRKLELAGELVREMRYVDPYVPGARVTVHLPMQDLQAVIVKLVGRNRAMVDTPLCRVTVPIYRLQIV